MAEVRRADVTWEGDLTSGRGNVTAATSRAFTSLPVSWLSRTGAHDTRTSPEELLASAHASCYAMAFSADLGRAGFTPTKLEVSSSVTFDRVDGKWTVVSSALKVRGWVPNADDATFKKVAEGAKDGCPISRALKGNVQLGVDATLEKSPARK